MHTPPAPDKPLARLAVVDALLKELCILLLFLWTTEAFPQQANAAETCPCYIANASSDRVGLLQIIASKRGLRIDFQDKACTLTASPPAWKVTVFNRNTKAGLSMSYSDWLKHRRPALLLEKDWLFDTKIRAKRKGRYFGLGTEVYELAPRPGGATAAAYYVADIPDLPQEQMLIVQKFVDMPQAPGLPIRFTFEDNKSRNAKPSGLGLDIAETKYRTATLVRSMCDPAIFSSPQKYLQKSSEKEVVFDEKRKQTTETTIMDLLGGK